MSRDLTTGRFDSRKELEEKVKFLYLNTNMSMAEVGQNVEVSETTVRNIIDGKFSGQTKAPGRFPPYKEVLMNCAVEIRSFLQSCGDDEVRDSFARLHNAMNLAFAKCKRTDLCSEPFKLPE